MSIKESRSSQITWILADNDAGKFIQTFLFIYVTSNSTGLIIHDDSTSIV